MPSPSCHELCPGPSRTRPSLNGCYGGAGISNRIMQRLLLALLLAYLNTNHVHSYTYYTVNHAPFMNTSSTIPASSSYFNDTANLQWYDVFWDNKYGDCGEPPIDLPATHSNYFLNSHCVSSMIPTNFSYYLYPFARGLQIIPSLGTIHFFKSSDDPIYFTYTFNTLLVTLPQPDLRLNFATDQTFFFGFNSEKLWNSTSANFTFTYVDVPAPVNATYPRPSSIFILRGSVISYMNASHPLTQTRLKFELQIFELTEVIVMHIIELSHASADDLWHPLSIGSLLHLFPNNVQGSMALNNEFLSPTATQAAPYATTITFTPWVNDEGACSVPANSPCQNCLSHGPLNRQCFFCPTTGTCLEVDGPLDLTTACPISSTSMPINMTQTGPNPIYTNNSICPPETYHTCSECVAGGWTWCTGEADCGVTDTEECKGYSNGNGFDNLDWTSFIPRCVPPSQSCGEITCSDLYSASHVTCGVTQTDAYSYKFIKCTCEPGYLRADQTTYDPGSITQCSVCDTANGYYEPEAGTCELCPSITPGKIGGLCVAAIVITFLLVKLNSHPLVQKLMIPIQNSIVYFQVISLLALIDFHWPLAIKNGFTFFAVLGLNFFHLSSVQCWLTQDQKLLIAVISPAVIGGLLLICSLLIIIYKRIQRCIIKTELSEMHRVIHKRRELFRRAFISFLLLFYNYLVYTCMSSWFTIDFWNAWVNQDQHNGLKGTNQQRFWLALIGTVFYAGGIPLLFWFLIFPRTEIKYPSCCPSCCRKQVAQTIAVQPLISRYRQGYCQYWEVMFVCLWKLLFNAIIVFISSRRTQIILIAVLLVCMILSYAYFQPYVSGINNREQQWLMSGSLIILFGGVLFYVGSPGDTGGKLALVVISFIIVIATMSFMMLVIVYVIVTVIQEYRSSQSDSLQDPEYDLEEEFIYSDQPQTRHSINNPRSNSIPTNILPDTVLKAQQSSSLPSQSSLTEMSILTTTTDDPFTGTTTAIHPTAAISIEDSNSLQLNPAVVKSDEMVLNEFVRPLPSPSPPSPPPTTTAFNSPPSVSPPIDSSSTTTTTASDMVATNEAVTADQQLLDLGTMRSEM